MNVNGAITLQINVSLIVGFTDGTIDTFHIHSDKTNILINSEANIKKEMENQINDIKDKFETQRAKATTLESGLKYFISKKGFRIFRNC